jgi:hypothetical protein
MDNRQKEVLIEKYLKAYNAFDIEGMLQDFDEGIRFKNINNKQVDLETYGLVTFKKQAEFAGKIFSSRKQIPLGYEHVGDKTTVPIYYEAVLAIDLPNGMKAGQKIELNGKSHFQFDGHKIILLIDES